MNDKAPAEHVGVLRGLLLTLKKPSEVAATPLHFRCFFEKLQNCAQPGTLKINQEFTPKSSGEPGQTG
jgi:hypothetical protein